MSMRLQMIQKSPVIFTQYDPARAISESDWAIALGVRQDDAVPWLWISYGRAILDDADPCMEANEGVAATFDDGTVKGNGVDIQIQSATATVNGVTFTSLINKGNIDGKPVDIKVQLAKVGGQTAGVLVDPVTGVTSTYTGTLTLILADGTKVTVTVVNGKFVVV